jgi:hypothetical protein
MHRPVTIAVGKCFATLRTAALICAHPLITRYSKMLAAGTRGFDFMATSINEHNKQRTVTSGVMNAMSGSVTIGDSVPS